MKAKGLLFGLNYQDTNNELRGCINDVENVSTFLKRNHGIQSTCKTTFKGYYSTKYRTQPSLTCISFL